MKKRTAMTKEHYIKRMDELHYEISLLKAAYIEANKPCEKGAKVSVKDGNKRVFGIITGFKIGVYGDIEMIGKKLKVDGTISTVNLWIWSGADLQFVH